MRFATRSAPLETPRATLPTTFLIPRFSLPPIPDPAGFDPPAGAPAGFDPEELLDDELLVVLDDELDVSDEDEFDLEKDCLICPLPPEPLELPPPALDLGLAESDTPGFLSGLAESDTPGFLRVDAYPALASDPALLKALPTFLAALPTLSATFFA